MHESTHFRCCLSRSDTRYAMDQSPPTDNSNQDLLTDDRPPSDERERAGMASQTQRTSFVNTFLVVVRIQFVRRQCLAGHGHKMLFFLGAVDVDRRRLKAAFLPNVSGASLRFNSIFLAYSHLTLFVGVKAICISVVSHSRKKRESVCMLHSPPCLNPIVNVKGGSLIGL